VIDIAGKFFRQGVEFDEENADWLVVPNYQLPSNWHHIARTTALMVIFPNDYPRLPPIGFYLPDDLPMAHDGHLIGFAAHGASNAPIQEGWKWYCVYIHNGAWQPSRGVASRGQSLDLLHADWRSARQQGLNKMTMPASIIRFPQGAFEELRLRLLHDKSNEAFALILGKRTTAGGHSVVRVKEVIYPGTCRLRGAKHRQPSPETGGSSTTNWSVCNRAAMSTLLSTFTLTRSAATASHSPQSMTVTRRIFIAG
jgi:hypothetical protein